MTEPARRAMPWWGVIRVLAVAAAGAVVVGGVSVAADLSGPPRQQPEAAVVDLVGDTQLACPGIELAGIAGVPDVPVAATVTAVQAPREVVPRTQFGSLVLTAGATSTTAEPGVGARLKVTGASPVLVAAAGPAAAATVARQTWQVDRDGLAGLTSLACGSPLEEVWLLGGGAGAGRLERLVLVNPGANPVTARIEVHGAAGLIAAAGSEVTVPPRSRLARLLDAVAAAEVSPAVRVRTNGGGLVAALADTYQKGSAALGVDTTSPTAPAAATQLIPAVVTSGAASVRILVPGRQEAVVGLRVLGAAGLVQVPSGAPVTRVSGGSVVDVPLRGLTPGTYAVEVTADVPVLASALGATARTTGGELTWSTATPALRSFAGAVIESPAAAPQVSTLHLVAREEIAEVTVWTVLGGKVSSVRERLGPDRVTSLPVTGDSVWVTVSSGSVHGAVAHRTPSGGVSVVPLGAPAVTSSQASALWDPVPGFRP